MTLSNKYVLFVLIPTIQDFLSDVALKKIDNTFDNLVLFIKEKTGFDFSTETDILQSFLNSLLNNSEMFVTLITMQILESVAEDFLLNPKDYYLDMWRIVKNVFPT
ncbi:MAG: hypothetical protein PWP46_460 [Fusobacteriaceae bacterium]|jgi:hypothetical protein|nr:hypothetical protein [Fusobacteriaceae bacterium]